MQAQEQQFCQSCGMPLTPEQLGTHANGTPSTDYCTHCYQQGAFTSNISMDEMIALCAEYVDEMNKASGEQMTREEAIAQMKQYFPMLKRWKA